MVDNADPIGLKINNAVCFSYHRNGLQFIPACELLKGFEDQAHFILCRYNNNIQQSVGEAGFWRYGEIISKLVAVGNAYKKSIC